MPRLGDLYPRFEPAMRALGREGVISEQDLLTSRFLLERDDRFAIYYAPLDWLRPTARVAIVGITPGKNTMLRAYRTVASGLATGRAARSVLNDAKDNSFSGFRPQLVGWLDWLGVARQLGVPSTAAMWTPAARHQLHPTSSIRYPTFERGKNYGGSKAMLKRSLLRRYLIEVLAPELNEVPDALVVPLGINVDAAIRYLASQGAIDAARCLVGFPHPSGNNGGRMKQWDANHVRLKRQVARWFSAHPAA
jgi:hypothetical protein